MDPNANRPSPVARSPRSASMDAPPVQMRNLPLWSPNGEKANEGGNRVSATQRARADAVKALVQVAGDIKRDWNNKSEASRDEDQKDNNVEAEITTRYAHELEVITQSKSKAASLPVTPASEEERLQQMNAQAESFRGAHKAEYARAAEDAKAENARLEEARATAQRDLEQARLASTKRLEEMQEGHHREEELEKAKRIALEKDVANSTRRLENERRDAMAKANEDEAQVQSKIKAETQKRLDATRRDKRGRMGEFLGRVIDAVTTVAGAITGEHSAHNALQTHHDGLEEGHGTLVQRVDENDRKHEGHEEARDTLEAKVNQNKIDTDDAITTAKDAAREGIDDAKRELGDEFQQQNDEIRKHLGDHDFNNAITKKHILRQGFKHESPKPDQERYFGDNYGAVWRDRGDQLSRRRLAAVDTPSERALARRCLANQTKSHTVVLETLLEEITRLN